MDGTCVEAEPVHVPDRDEPVIFTFFSDISYHCDILDQATVLQETIRSGISSLLKQAHWWKKYRGLWKVQKVRQRFSHFLLLTWWITFIFLLQDVILEKFALKDPSCEMYDEKMHFYSTVEADIVAQPIDKQVKFILLHMGSLSTSLKNIAHNWVTSLGKLLNDSARSSLTKLDTQLDVRNVYMYTSIHVYTYTMYYVYVIYIFHGNHLPYYPFFRSYQSILWFHQTLWKT